MKYSLNKYFVLFTTVFVCQFSFSQSPSVINFGVGYYWLDPLIYNNKIDNFDYALDFSVEPPRVQKRKLFRLKSYHTPLNSINIHNHFLNYNFDGIVPASLSKTKLDSLYNGFHYHFNDDKNGSYYLDHHICLPFDTSCSVFFVSRNSKMFGEIGLLNDSCYLVNNKDLFSGNYDKNVRKLNWLSQNSGIDSICVLGNAMPIKYNDKVLIIATVVRRDSITKQWGNWEIALVWYTKNGFSKPKFVSFNGYQEKINSPMIPTHFWPVENKIIFSDVRIGSDFERKWKVCNGHVNDLLVATLDFDNTNLLYQNILDLRRSKDYFAANTLNNIGKIVNNKYYHLINGSKDCEEITLKTLIEFSHNYKIMYVSDKYGGLGIGFHQIQLSVQNVPIFSHYFPIDKVMNFVNNNESLSTRYKDLISEFSSVTSVDKTVNFTYGKNGKLYVAHCNPLDDNKIWLSCILNPDSLGSKMAFKRNYLLLDSSLTPQTSEISYRARKPFSARYENAHQFVKFKFVQKCDGILLENQSNEIFKSFKWYISDSLISNDTNRFFKLNLNRTGKYFLKLHGFTVDGYDAWYSDTIYVNLGPESKIFYNDSLGCQFIRKVFIDNTSLKSKGREIKISWDFGDGQSWDTSFFNLFENKEMNMQVSHIYNSSGIYSIKSTVNDGVCVDSFRTIGNIIIKPASRPGLQYSLSKLCAPAEIQVNNRYATLDSSVFYLFDFAESKEAIIKQMNSFIISNGGKYKIIQRIFNSSGCISKDSVNLYLSGSVPKNSAPYIYHVTVENDFEVKVSWNSIPNVKYYVVKRDDKFLTQTNDTFLKDVFKQNIHKSFKYSVVGIDSCLSESSKSNEVYSIYLTVEDVSVFTNELKINWNKYWNLKTDTFEYRFQKFNSGDNKFETKLITLDTNSVYFDSQFNGESIGCFKVTAIQQGFKMSESNVFCLPYIPKIIIPNSITPNDDNLNDYFEVIYNGFNQVNLVIFNQWGQKIFENFKELKWQPRKTDMQGVYIALIKGTANDKIYEFTQLIHVLK